MFSERVENLPPEETLTDDQRIDIFSETGDPTILTVDLAHRFEISANLMEQVSGATEADIERAKERDTNDAKEYQEKYLKPYGLDDVSLMDLFDKSPTEYIRHLIELTQITPNRFDADKQSDDRDAIEQAKRLIVEFMREQQDGLLLLCKSVRIYESAGMRDVQVLKYVHNYFYDRFVKLSNQPNLTENERNFAQRATVILNEFAEVSNEVFELEWPDDANYLTVAYFHNLALELKFSEPTTLDNDELPLISETIGLERLADFNPDTLVPFEVSRGKYALFGTDTNVLYILDEEASSDVMETIAPLVEQIEYTVSGQYFGRRVTADVPSELSFETEIFYDAGCQLGRDTPERFTTTEQMRDYLYMMRRAMRETIEADFGISLADLTIQEQVFLLGYLQQATVKTVQVVSEFMSKYGVTGMRTFLALERGATDLGDQIVAFGQHEDIAKRVFTYYNELIDLADAAENIVRSKLTDVDEEAIRIATNNIRNDILAKAQYDLERAVRADDISQIADKVDTYKAAAKVYVALLKEVERIPLESVPARTLSEATKSNARRLSYENYKSEPERFQTLIHDSLESAFLRDTTRFYLETDTDGKLIFFDRFDDITSEDGRRIKYFGSVNSDQAYTGIGKLRIDETLTKELQNCDAMFAHCDPRNPISQFYIEHGFVATNTVEPEGKFSFEIWRSKDSNEQLKTKQMSQDELVAMAGATMPAEADYFVREVEPDDQFLELDSGLAYLLTRYFTRDGKTYAAFELQSTLSKSFVAPVKK